MPDHLPIPFPTMAWPLPLCYPGRMPPSDSSSRPVAVDLFAGAGGMSLGFEGAGFDVKAAVEVDPVHCAAHAFNFPGSAVIPRSVVGLTAGAIREAAGSVMLPSTVSSAGHPAKASR